MSSALARWPNVQRDADGRVVAFSGLSLLPTAHRFFVRGRQLYTWCAWDTLFLPALLDQEARVESTRPMTGAEVRLTVGPERVLASQPDEVWVSFPPPAETSTVNITESFCCHVHFLAGPEPATRWLTGRDGAMALALEDAFVLGRVATRAFATPDSDGGRYGALAAADPASRPLFAGIQLADSLTLDPHKWLYVPIDCGALLVRDSAATASAFGAGAGDYVRVLADQETESFAFWEHGLELSRRFRALKVWMTLRYYGARRIAATIAGDIALAAQLAELVGAHQDLELLAGPGLSICCFRHVPAGMPEAELDAHNARLLETLQRDGRVYLSNATVDGRLALRACITNFRTTHADAERTVDIVRELGASLTEG